MTRRKPTPKPGDLVIVCWEDILESPQWTDVEHPEGSVQHCESVGYVSRWGRKVVLVRTYGTGDDKRVAGDTLTIPRGCVTSWEVVRAKEVAP